MIKHTQDPPFTVKVELTEGCNLFCHFCGVHGIREKPGNYKFMTKETAMKVAEQIAEAGWNSKIEFTMHGEPSLNPEYEVIVGIFMAMLPKTQLMMTTNGAGFLKKPGAAKRLKRIFEIGLWVLAVDDYEHSKFGDKIRLGVNDILMEDPSFFEVHDFPDEPEFTPNKKYKFGTRKVIFVKDLSRTPTGTRSLCNHCGCAAPLNYKMKNKRCARPFRELPIRWDGNVIICCNDWRGVYACGNVLDIPLYELWQGRHLNAARAKMYAGQRDFPPCLGCDAKSFRVGCLPDKLGKTDMPPPDADCLNAIEEAQALGPLTEPVLRPWEKGEYGIRRFLKKK